MDPEATLKEMLILADRLTWHDSMGDAARLAELVLAMDGWLRRGGNLPNAWDRLNWTKKGER